MKKASKLKSLGKILIVLFTMGTLMLAHVALKKKCGDLKKQKVDAEDIIKNESNKTTNLFAKYQNLTSEERIIPIANNELGMIPASVPISVITIESEKVLNLQTLLQEEHDKF